MKLPNIDTAPPPDEKAEVSARTKGTDIDGDMARERGEPAPWGAGFGLVSAYR
jgi:hypothetical protein